MCTCVPAHDPTNNDHCQLVVVADVVVVVLQQQITQKMKPNSTSRSSSSSNIRRWLHEGRHSAGTVPLFKARHNQKDSLSPQLKHQSSAITEYADYQTTFLTDLWKSHCSSLWSWLGVWTPGPPWTATGLVQRQHIYVWASATTLTTRIFLLVPSTAGWAVNTCSKYCWSSPAITLRNSGYAWTKPDSCDNSFNKNQK